MNRISFYLFTQLLIAVAFASVAVIVVVWFSQSIRLLSLVINSGGSVWAFFKLMLFLLPSFLPLVLPISLMVGCVFVYQRLLAENEMQVMRAVGMSPMDLARPALLLGAIVAFLCYVMAIWIAPAANHALVRLQYEIRSDFSMLLLRTGSFHDISSGLSFYASERGKNGELKNLLIHDARKPDKPSTIMADSGELIRTEHGPNILVKNGLRQEFDTATQQLSQLTFSTYLVDLTSVDNSFDTRWREPRERSIAELMNPEGTDNDPLTIGRFMAELHLRLTMPFLAITFTMIACAFILTGYFERRGISRKIILVVAIVIGLEAAMLSTINMVARNNWMVIALYLIPFGPLPFLLHRLKCDNRQKFLAPNAKTETP